MRVAAGLMLMGAIVNGIGIRNPRREQPPAEEEAPMAEAAPVEAGTDHEHVEGEECLICPQAQTPVVVRSRETSEALGSARDGAEGAEPRDS
jgi:hypothetical protein